MLRGGSYWNEADHCRSAIRNRNDPAIRFDINDNDNDNDNDNNGFRPVLAAPLPNSRSSPMRSSGIEPEQTDLRRPRPGPDPDPPAAAHACVAPGGSPSAARLADPEHIDAAIDVTCRGKHARPDVAWFLFDRARHAARLCAGLADGTWRPARFDLLYLRDPKPRVIARAPVADRVVHTALAMLMEPVLLRSAAPGDLACRRGGGQHRALLRLLRAMRQFRFALHLDVRAYFPSIDIDVLRTLLVRRFRDRPFLAVLDRVLESGRGLYDSPRARRHARLGAAWPPRGQGLPMGAVTSQLLAAHLYLQQLDHLAMRSWRVGGYTRYVDDLFLFGDRRCDLRRWRADIGEWLAAERHLRLKHLTARILSCRGHLDALGWRIRRDGLEPLPVMLRRLHARVDGFARGERSLAALERSLRASLGQGFLF
ncbi:MAG: hypothetical protein IPM29_04565 [Planctomycetes bacterium]|nr:hypothetical protein [Planctomycetota bacterium]